MNFVDLINRKIHQELSREEITFFANGAADGSIPDYQLAAMLMAIRLKGMTRRETADLAIAMEQTGDECDLSEIPGIPVDKHSTGGVGDTTTLIVAPLVASCGVPVAKMSGRGLGHTGGTLDKLESIPGFSISMEEKDFIRQVKEIGLAVIGQTKNLAPADKTLYALRDVTATVASVPLIASSIMSKKLASGAKGIVLDVKTGDGALMNTLEESIALARAMVEIGTDAGRNIVALVTGMDEPLGSHVGNALEVKEAIDVLSGRTAGPLLEVSLQLGIQLMLLGKGAETPEEAREKLTEALESGRGLNTLRKMILAQGGDPACCEDTAKLPQAPIQWAVPSIGRGYVEKMNTIGLGDTARELGAGRWTKTDVIDPGVGFVLCRRIGDFVEKGETLAVVHASTQEKAQMAAGQIQSLIKLTDSPVPPAKLIHALVTSEGTELY